MPPIRRASVVALLVSALALTALGGCAAPPPPEPVASSLETFIASVDVSAGTDAEVRLVNGQLGYGSGDGPELSLPTTATVVNGGSIQQYVSWAQPFRTIRFAVEDLATGSSSGLPDFGYYEIELSAAVTDAVVLLTIRQDIPAERFAMYFRTADAAGRGGPIARQEVAVVPVGTGDVQISVSWDVDSDLDLHVVEPGGEEIFYEDTRSSTGGQLDLDSNAGCSIDGIRNENVTWDSGSAPSGTYRVLVDLYDSCDRPPTNYIVTVTVGGVTQTYRGTAYGTGTLGGRGSGEFVAEFSVG